MTSKTVTVQIGNSDDKLSQYHWAEFVKAVQRTVEAYTSQIYFFGTSIPTETWQNAAWVFEIEEESSAPLQRLLRRTARMFSQDSIAWTEGATSFLTPE